MINSQLFSSIVLMVVITTVIAPSLLKYALRRGVCENGVNETGTGSNHELAGWRPVAVSVLTVARTQGDQNKFGRAIQNWTGTNGVLEIYAGDKLVRRFTKSTN